MLHACEPVPLEAVLNEIHWIPCVCVFGVRPRVARITALHNKPEARHGPRMFHSTLCTYSLTNPAPTWNWRRVPTAVQEVGIWFPCVHTTLTMGHVCEM